MTKFARIMNGEVIECITLSAGVDITDAFHPDLAGQFVAAPGDVEPGWLYDGEWQAPPVPASSEPTSSAVDFERDRRIAAGFSFGGVQFQAGTRDRENIAGAKSAASDAIALGAQVGDFGWQRLLDPTAPEVFAWIAADNVQHPMDAQTMVQVGYAALAHTQRMIFAARALKDAQPIPSDFTDDAYWLTA